MNDGLQISSFCFYNACYWLLSREALTEKDIDKLEEIREHRNFIAHQLTHILIDRSYDVNFNLLIAMRDFIEKIDNWHALLAIFVEPGTLNIVEPTESERAMMHARVVVLDLLINSVKKKGQSKK